MIAARQIAFGKAAGAKKPYDAEIEYLESTSTSATNPDRFPGREYINIGHFPYTQFRVRMDIIPNFNISYVSRPTLFGNNSTSDNNGVALYCNWGQYTFGYGNNATRIGSDIARRGVRTIIDITIGSDTQTLVIKAEGHNQQSATLTVSCFPTDSRDMYLLNNNGSIVDGGKIAQVRLFGVQIYDSNNNLVRDFIPVRKGNVGYMYDRVSGQLFGNQGTGEFVLGADI
jgi:hypothetical protein